MKTKEITTIKATILVLDMSGMTHAEINTSTVSKDIWHYLGQLSDITEEQWKQVVDDHDDGYFYYPDGYKDTCDTAKESGLSLLKANGVILENDMPFPDMNDSKYYDEPKPLDGSGFYQEIYNLDAIQWRDLEKQVWQNVHIFIKR